MLRRLLCLLLILAGPTTVLPARAQDLPPEATEAWRIMTDVTRLEAQFEQRRTSSLLREPLVSTGVLRFERPDKLAWVVNTPGRSTMVISGHKLGLAYPDLGVREEVELGGDPEVERLVRGMFVWLAGDLALVQKDYKVEWRPGAGADGLDLAVLTPTASGLRGLIGTLELSIGGEPKQVQAVRITEPDGDHVDIRLHGVRIDPVLPGDAFTLAGASGGASP